MKKVTRFILWLLLISNTACSSLSTQTIGVNPSTPIQSDTFSENAFQVARQSCSLLHSMELLPPKNVEAIITTMDKAEKMLNLANYEFKYPIPANSKVWFVRLTGRWGLIGGPAPELTTPIAPAPTPELWNKCEVIIDAKDWHSVHVSERWDANIP